MAFGRRLVVVSKVNVQLSQNITHQNFIIRLRNGPRKNPRAARCLACSVGAIGYLVQLSEYKKGRQALEGVTELVQGLRQDLELVQGMGGLQFVAWLEDVG